MFNSYFYLIFLSLQIPDLEVQSPPPQLYGDTKRMLALAASMHEFNLFVKNHPNLESVLLPLRDGLTVIKYNSPK